MPLLDDNALRRVWAKIKAGFVAKETGKGLSTNDYTTAEKQKLAGIAEGASTYTHPAYTARTGKPTGNQTPGFGETFTVSQIKSDATGHVTAATDRTVTVPDDVATNENDGLMSATDKAKLDGIDAGANAYTHPAYTARTGKPTGNQTPGFGESFTISQITSDATGHVTGATDRTVTMPDDVASNENDGLMSAEDKEKLDNLPTNLAVFARNVGEIEGELTEARAEHAGIIQALAGANVMYLNTPNLLKPNAWFTNSNGSDIIYGDATQYGGPGAWMDSISDNRRVTFDHEPTAEESAGAYRIYHREAGTDSSGHTWTEAWIVSWQVDDSISTSCVTLTGDDIITEISGESFNKAIQYNITANTAYGNTEDLVYPRGIYQRVFDVGKEPDTHNYEVPEMEVGETYTMSCWARVISGDGAFLKFAWGGQYYNTHPGYPSGKAGASDWITLNNTDTEWKRLTWSFVFAPEGPQYTETTADGKVTRTYDWQKRVMFSVGRKYTSVIQLAGFRLTKGGLYGNNTIDTLAAEIQAARDESAAAAAAAQAINTRLVEAEKKVECMQALGFAGHGIRVEKVFSGVNDTGIGEYILEANHEAGDAYAYRNGSGWVVMAYDADNDSWVSWPTT